MANPFSDFFGKLGQIFQQIVAEFNKALFLAGVIQGVKDDVKAEFQQIEKEIQDIFSETDDFIQRAKNIKTHVIRVDIAINLIDDIRSGKLKDFLNSLRDEFAPQLEQILQTVHDTTQQFGSLSRITNISQILIKILSVWTEIEKIVKLLAGVVPIVQQIHDKLQELESSILQQKNKRQTVTAAARERVGKLHSSSAA